MTQLLINFIAVLSSRTNKTIPASEPRPRRAKELLEDLRSKHQGTPATKIPSQRNPKENQELSKRCVKDISKGILH